jgi:hypothetical protein
MNRPEDILETEKYIEPLRFSTESESILFHSYVDYWKKKMGDSFTTDILETAMKQYLEDK